MADKTVTIRLTPEQKAQISNIFGASFDEVTITGEPPNHKVTVGMDLQDLNLEAVTGGVRSNPWTNYTV